MHPLPQPSPGSRTVPTSTAALLGAVGNVYCDDVIRRNFIRGPVRATVKPLIGIEEFGAGPIA